VGADLSSRHDAPRIPGRQHILALGKFEQAAEEAKKATKLDPDHPFNYGNLAANYIFHDRLPDAQNVLQKASQRKLEIPELLALRFRVAFLTADRTEMERLASRAREKSGTEEWISDLEASVAAYSGHLQQVRLKSAARGVEDLEKRCDRILDETCNLFRSNENVWCAPNGWSSLSIIRKRLGALYRQERQIYLALLQMAIPLP
jgi:hypothetical protein